MMDVFNRKTHWYCLALTVLVADQVAKSVIAMITPLGWLREVTPVFNLVHTLNPGAAFGFLAGVGGWQRWFFLIFALGASIWLVWILSKPLKRLEAISFSLILGGALGNAFDRATRGQVIDYLDFYLGELHWPAFNIADIAITVGVISMIVTTFLGHDSAKKPEDS